MRKTREVTVDGGRIWYSTGFIPEKAEEWGGLERVAKEIPTCLQTIKENAGKRVSRFITKEESVLFEYEKFCHTLFDDLDEAYKDEWKKNKQINDLYQIKENHDNSEFEDFNFKPSKYEKLIPYAHIAGIISVASTCYYFASNAAIKHYSNITSDPKLIGHEGFKWGFISAIAGLIAVPSLFFGCYKIYDLITGSEKKYQEKMKMIDKKFLSDIDGYISK